MCVDKKPSNPIKRLANEKSTRKWGGKRRRRRDTGKKKKKKKKLSFFLFCKENENVVQSEMA